MTTGITVEPQDFVECDEFADEEFVDKNAPLPTVVVLNDQYNYGYFIPVNTMAKCGWLEFDENQLIEHTYRSGNTDRGILIRHPRMLCVPKTALYQYDVKASREQRTKVIVGWYNPALKGDENIKPERLYLVFFLNQNNEPLHTSALKYLARGANGTTFELERRAFKAELEACHAITNQVPAKPKNDLFHALGVSCFTTKPELVGDEQKKSWACRIVSHEKPTTENWKQYFVGYSSLKNYAWAALEPGQKIDVLSVPVLAASEERTALPQGSELHRQPTPEEEAIANASLFPTRTTVTTHATVGYDSVDRVDDLSASDEVPNIPF